MKDVKVVQFGCGNMSRYIMRYVYEKGGMIVGAIDLNQELIGKDISEVIGCEEKGIIITPLEEAENLLKEVQPDICIITTMSLMQDCKDALLMCARLGINAITTCEEAFYPFNSSPRLTDEIDKLAKENNCTITGSGYQDVFWGNLITTIAGATASIKEIKGSSSYNVEDYGIALAKAHGAGLTLEQFDKEIAAADNISEQDRNKLIEKGEFLPSYMWNAAGWLCDKLNLTPISMNQKCVPITHDEDIYSETLNMNIKAKDAIGMSAVVTCKTKEGIDIIAECIGKVYPKGTFDLNEWTVKGEPDTHVVIERPQTVELTCASIVNRIPDVLSEESGFIPTSKMGEINYLI